jgi:NAD(P)H-hydrate epimerase
VVVDADGINALAPHMDIVRERRYPTVFTPHPGEFSTMGGDTAADRVTAAKCMAEDLGITLVLKGHNTVVTDGKTVYVNPTGNPGMAVGGSGDVLAGMIVSLIGQGLSPLSAAACGVYLHGLAGDVCAKRMGQYGMLPSDMLGELPRLMK